MTFREVGKLGQTLGGPVGRPILYIPKLMLRRCQLNERASLLACHAHGHASWHLASIALLSVPAYKFIEHNSKPRKCKECYAAAKKPCCLCQGRGKTGLLLPKRLQIGKGDGQKIERCTRCEGKGTEACRSCEATGLSNSWLWVPQKGEGIWGAPGDG